MKSKIILASILACLYTNSFALTVDIKNDGNNKNNPKDYKIVSETITIKGSSIGGILPATPENLKKLYNEEHKKKN